MLRYAKRTNTSEMKAFCCAVLILCLTTGHAMPQIASLCAPKSLHDTLCTPLLIVLRAKVLPLERSSSYKNGIYRLEVSQIFSAPNKGVCSIPWPSVFLQTPSSAISTTLNKTPELGVEYVLTGVFNETVKMMGMDRCSWYKKWKDMSTDDKKELLDKSCNEDSDNDNFP